MTRPVDVTFVVPNYNGAAFLGQTIESILAQRDPDFDLVVADNCSTDDSLDLARSYRDDRLTVAPATVHVSMTANWNRAMGYVRTPFAVLAHSDDVYEPDYLGVMLPMIRDRPHAFIAQCNVTNIDEHGEVLKLPLEKYKELFQGASDPYCRPPCEEAAWLRKGNYFQASTAVYRTEHARAIGPFNEQLQFVPDWEYWLRGVFAGYEIAGTRRQLVRYRRHSGSLSTAFEADMRRYREEIDLLEWLGGAGHAAGCFPDDRPEYGLVTNTLLSGIADRLVRGDAVGAARVAAFARSHIPGFTGSARDVAVRCALPLGTTGGRALAWARERYLELLRWRRI